MLAFGALQFCNLRLLQALLNHAYQLIALATVSFVSFESCPLPYSHLESTVGMTKKCHMNLQNENVLSINYFTT